MLELRLKSMYHTTDFLKLAGIERVNSFSLSLFFSGLALSGCPCKLATHFCILVTDNLVTDIS